MNENRQESYVGIISFFVFYIILPILQIAGSANYQHIQSESQRFTFQIDPISAKSVDRAYPVKQTSDLRQKNINIVNTILQINCSMKIVGDATRFQMLDSRKLIFECGTRFEFLKCHPEIENLFFSMVVKECRGFVGFSLRRGGALNAL